MQASTETVMDRKLPPLDAQEEILPGPDQAHVLARFWRTAVGFWSARGASVAWSLTIFLVLIVIVQLLVQFLLNQWNRNFFDAVERRDAVALWTQALLFVPLAVASSLLAAASVWGRMTTQRKWREYLLRKVAEYWLTDQRASRLDYAAHGCENPEYRVSEDIRIATDAPIDIVMALLASVLTAITFLSVLWNIGGALRFDVAGIAWSIPGYLVIGVVVYSALFSSMMMLVGHDLGSAVEREIQAEAELRAAADVLRRRGNGIGPSGADTGERRTFWIAVHVVLVRWRNLLWQLVRTTLVSHANFLLAPIVAWFLCLPNFLTGAMSLGELMQAAAAFVTVQGAFNWLVDNYQRVASWRTAAFRVATFLLALDALDATNRAAEPKQLPSTSSARNFA